MFVLHGNFTVILPQSVAANQVSYVYQKQKKNIDIQRHRTYSAYGYTITVGSCAPNGSVFNSVLPNPFHDMIHFGEAVVFKLVPGADGGVPGVPDFLKMWSSACASSYSWFQARPKVVFSKKNADSRDVKDSLLQKVGLPPKFREHMCSKISEWGRSLDNTDGSECDYIQGEEDEERSSTVSERASDDHVSEMSDDSYFSNYDQNEEDFEQEEEQEEAEDEEELDLAINEDEDVL